MSVTGAGLPGQPDPGAPPPPWQPLPRRLNLSVSPPRRPLPRRSPQMYSPSVQRYSPSIRSSSSSSQPFTGYDAPPSPPGRPPLVPFPEPGFVPQESDADSDAESDDSTDKAVVLISGKSLGAAREWLIQQAPVFFCGAAAAWVSLLFLWRTDHEALRDEVEAARVLLAELRHMSETVRMEVTAAQGLMASVSGSKAPIHTANEASSVRVLPFGATERVLQEGHSSFTASVGGEVPPLWASLPFQILWSTVLFSLDVGIVFFCLRQLTSHEARAQLEELVLRLLRYLGLGGCLEEPGAKAAIKGDCKQSASTANAVGACGQGESVPSPTSRVEPVAANALLVRRRDGTELAPVQKLQVQKQAEMLRDLRQRRSSIAMVTASLVGVAAVRLMAGTADLIGWRFFSHLITYAVLTIRVCLLAFLVLF